MVFDKFVNNTIIFSQLYKDKQIKPVWGKHRGGIKAEKDIEEILQTIDPNISPDDFISDAFDIMSISRLITLGFSPKDSEQKRKFEIVSEKFLTNSLKEEILINCTSTLSILENIDYQIITKRSKQNAEEIIGNTAILSIRYKDFYKNDYEPPTECLNLEVTKSDLYKLKETIEKVIKSLEQLNEKVGVENEQL